MTEAQIINTFNEQYSLIPTSQGWYSFDCPRCFKKRKAAIHPLYKQVKCWVCSYKENIVYFLSQELDKTPIEIISYINSRSTSSSLTLYNYNNTVKYDYDKIVETFVELPEGFKLLSEGDNVIGNRVRNYLGKIRGFNIEYLCSLGFGYIDDPDSDYFGFILIPFIKRGCLYYYICRCFINENIRYKNPPADLFSLGKSQLLWNEDALLTQDRLFVMEGVFSALAMGSEGVAIMGKTVSNFQLKKLIESNAKEIVICLDANTEKESWEFAYQLLPYKDTVKMLMLAEGDPDEMGTEHILTLYHQTKPITHFDLFTKYF